MQGLEQMLGASGMNLDSLGSRFGLDAEQTRSAVGALMPAVAGGVQKRAEADGLHGVTAAGSAIGHPDTAAGNDVLGQIFGSKDVSRHVADHAAGQSGLPGTVLKAMLPIVAAMAAKHLAANGAGAGGLLGSLADGGSAGGLAGLGGLLGGGGGGNPLDAILAGRR